MSVKDRKLKPVPHGTRYPWEKWFSKNSFTLRAGKDFHSRTYSMAGQIRLAAARLGHQVSIKINREQTEITVMVLHHAHEVWLFDQRPKKRKKRA